MIIGQVKPSLDELAHFGVKGMKWGVRRDRTQRKADAAELRKSRQRLAVVGAAIAVHLIATHGLVRLADMKSSNGVALSSTASKPAFVKPSRSGVHNITTMK